MNTIVSSGGSQIISSGGIASAAVISSGGSQYVRLGGSAVKTSVLSGGKLYVSSGGKAHTATVASGGLMTLYKCGLASGGKVIGSQAVSSGGIVRNMAITSKGVQRVFTGGVVSNCSAGTNGVQHVSGGTTYNMVLRPKGAQRVSTGLAVNTTISSGASQIISSGGIASAAVISSGGSQYVRLGGSAVRTNVMTGGRLYVSSGGKAITASVASGGSIYVYKGGRTSALTVKEGGRAYLYGGVLSGVNTVSGAVVTVKGTGVKINAIRADSATLLHYDIRNVQAGAGVMLAETVSQALSCKFRITTDASQGPGEYKLSSSLELANNTAFSIRLGSETLGTVRLNDAGYAKNGIEYAVKSNAGVVSLIYGLKAADLRKGSSGSNNLIGTENNEVFYGGAGNDRIYGVNGYDVAVYDTGDWGENTIAATEGRMTLLLAGFKSSDITTIRSGNDLLITKNADSSQNIVVEGWNDATHSIVYTDTLTQFSKYVNAASPTEAQANAARNEVWTKAGLASKA